LVSAVVDPVALGSCVGPGDDSAGDVTVADLYRVYYADLARLAVQLVGDPDAAEDVVQDVFVGLHRRQSLASLEDPRRYLITAVVNRSRSVLRRRRVARAFRPASERTAESAEAPSLRAAERARVLAALDRLPLRQREVLVLRYYRDLSVHEIAAVLSIAPSAVSSSLSRGLKALTATLDKEPR